MNIWFLGAGSACAFLAAAKAHGRQVRLERELAGVWEVIFGGVNPPAVEAIWRRDRLIFWSILAVSLLAATGIGAAAARFQWKLPPASGSDAVTAFGAWFLLAVAWSFILSFFLAGMASALRTWMAIRAGADQGPEWMSKALWGSLGWWGLLMGIMVLLAWTARRT